MATPVAQARRRRPGARLAALACACLLALAACADGSPEDSTSAAGGDTPGTGQGSPQPPGHAGPAGTDTAPPGAGRESHGTDPAPPPAAVEIPAIDVQADLVRLELQDDGSMEVPDFGLAGWYIGGPPPGAAGPAVIAAHYDSTDGPDVFYRLAELRPGDEIAVHRADGSTVAFVVEELEEHPKDDLPGDRIWAISDRPRLTLITCGGAFDRSTGHYTDNVIVYAAAV